VTRPLQLFDIPPAAQLTDRQQTALDAITAAGYDGLHTDELGAHVHASQGKHAADETCEWCPSVGSELGRRLRELGHAQQRPQKRWRRHRDGLDGGRQVGSPADRVFDLPEGF
jgi:hypothetical protein